MVLESLEGHLAGCLFTLKLSLHTIRAVPRVNYCFDCCSLKKSPNLRLKIMQNCRKIKLSLSFRFLDVLHNFNTWSKQNLVESVTIRISSQFFCLLPRLTWEVENVKFKAIFQLISWCCKHKRKVITLQRLKVHASQVRKQLIAHFRVYP